MRPVSRSTQAGTKDPQKATRLSLHVGRFSGEAQENALANQLELVPQIRGGGKALLGAIARQNDVARQLAFR